MRERAERPELGQLERALARTGDGCVVIDAGGRITFWNAAAEKMLGWPARDAVGRACCDVFAGIDDRGNRVCYNGCHVRGLAKLDEPVHSFDMRTRSRSGRPLWLNVSSLPLPTNGASDGAAAAMIHLFRDVSADKELLKLVHERLDGRNGGVEPGSPGASLSRRELEVLRLIVDGLNTGAIAERLHVSPATIRNHVQNIMGKLGVHSRLEAVAFATKHRLF
jgi:PAS domain S-box-containing protein